MIQKVQRLGGVELAAEFTDTDGPNVLLMHGLSSVRRLVLMGSKRLEKDGANLVSYDARGHGESSGVTSPDAYSYGALADDALAVFDSGRRRGEPFVAVGVSMGAHTALRLALDQPDRIAALVLITPAFDPDVAVPDYSGWDRLADGLQANGVAGFIDSYDFSSIDPRWRDLAVTATSQRMERHHQIDCVAAALRGVPRSRPFEAWAQLNVIDVPTAVIGSRDEADPGHPLELASRVVESIPQARLLVEEQGQSPLAWRGAAISEVVAALIDTVEQGSNS